MSDDIPEPTLEDRMLVDSIRTWLASAPAVGEDAAARSSALHRLLGEARDLPAASLIRLFRELDGMRRPLRVAVCGDAGVAALARGRFGSRSLYLPYPNPESALDFIRRGQGPAVIALGDRPWWARLLAEPELSVFGLLPETGGEGGATALIVGREPHRPCGAQETLLVTERADAEMALLQLGLASRFIASAAGLKLLALTGYVQADDARLTGFSGGLNGVIGAAPAPFDL
ncbi:hypothetical protein Q0812_00510 [Brevundimonas sp. 2R-24]|uniref:Uncharacterized protein n=1 Tax=Peiella sedimenti TaxID=3061083 RepID=A0ABT8SH67_9CAUL|nr:hypothetical protein [Caulobacteraceae bacterium XZ-24]